VREALALQARLYAEGRGNQRTESLVFNARALLDGLGVVAAITGLLGCLAIALRPRRGELAIPAFVLVYLIVVSIPATHFERNLMPVVAYLAVAAALLVVRSAARSTRGRPSVGGIPSRGLAAGLVLVVAAIALLPGLAAAYADGRRLELADTRTVAREWMLANIPHNSVIAREQYTPQLRTDEYRLRNHPFLWERDWAWYREVGTEYLVTSSLNYARFHENPDDPVHDAFYRELFALPEVFRVDPTPDRPGPTIRIFELPESG
jgi:hypothetical protein